MEFEAKSALEGEKKLAERFDFSMNNCIYKLNMRVDEFGERI